MIRGVLFDWGDTLFAHPPAPRVIAEFARERGVAMSDADAVRLWRELWDAGKTPEEHAKGRDLSPEAHRDVWVALFRRAERTLPGVAELLYERVMDPDRWTPFADTEPTLRALKERGMRIGVVSNIPRDLRPIFARHGLADLVDGYVLSYEQGVAKPDPALFHAACARLHTRHAETLMVGDDAASDGGAARAGLRVLLLPEEWPGDVRGLDRVVRLVDEANGERRHCSSF